MAKLLKASDVGAQIYYKIRADYLQKIPYGHEYVVPVAHDKIMAEQGLREDHIAFRTFFCPMGGIPAGILSVERIFGPLGWQRGLDENGAECRYDFPNMHVRAIHLEFPVDRPDLPKMFVSELVVDELEPQDAAALKADLADTPDPLTEADKRMLGQLESGALIDEAHMQGLIERTYKALTRPWLPPHRKTVLQVDQRSQYTAWTLLNGGMNHVAYLTDNLEETAAKHAQAGRDLLPKIMGSKEVGLLQTSVRSPMFDFAVRDAAADDGQDDGQDDGMINLEVREDDGTIGTIRWTGPFAEIIERPLNENGTRRENFLAENAAHIFAATKNKEVGK